MQITVAVSEHELTEMATSPEMLKESIRNALMRGIEDECGTLYLSDVSVEVNVIPASAASHGDCQSGQQMGVLQKGAFARQINQRLPKGCA